MINPNCAGGGLHPPPPPPPTNFAAHANNRHAFSAASWLFPWSLTYILTQCLWKSDILLRSHMTFCDHRSTWKVGFFFPFCVQNIWQSKVSILANNQYYFPLLALYIIYSNLHIDPNIFWYRFTLKTHIQGCVIFGFPDNMECKVGLGHILVQQQMNRLKFLSDGRRPNSFPIVILSLCDCRPSAKYWRHIEVHHLKSWYWNEKKTENKNWFNS